MRRLGTAIMVLAVVALAATPAFAQRQRGGRGGPGGAGGGSVMLLTQESVQKELKLTEDQVGKVKELQAKIMEGFRGLRDLPQEERRQKAQEAAKANEKALAEILKPEQSKRLKQVSLQSSMQFRGAGVFSDAEVASALKLNEEQKDKLLALQEDFQAARQELGRGEGTREKMAALTKKNTEKAMKVLTEEQTAKWKELTGEPFKGQIQFGPPGGRRRGGNNQN